jgi:hypothetical protein
MYVLHSTEKPLAKNSCREYARSITYSESVCVALVIQHVLHVRHTVFSLAVRLALTYISTFCCKVQDFQKKVIEYDICVLIFSAFVGNISHFKSSSARYYHISSQVFV